MPTITTAFRFALTAAALCAAVPTADARPRRVVVLDFDGPRQLADAGKSSVLSALGEQYDIVATQRWEQARADAAQKTHGPAQWARAAKQSGVDAVIDGWVQDEGRRKILNIVVRQADNGHEFDTISIRLDGKTGTSAEGVHQLQAKLDEVLDWIDGGRAEPPPWLPPVEVKQIGPSKPPADDGAPRGRDHRADEDAPPAAPTRPSDRSDGGDKPAAEPAHDKTPIEVATADRETHDIEVLFPQGSEERREIEGVKAEHVPQPTPRFMIDGGGYMGSRSLVWDAPPDANVTQFAGVSTRGFQVNAAVYPFPTKQIDGVLSGLGFTAQLHHSAGSTVEFDDGETISEYVLNQNGWELGAHYRLPINGLVAIDGGAFYGTQTFDIVDAAQTFEVPDTKYSYLGASVHLDLAITDRATVGFGARYFTVLDAGDLASTDWFGPVSASGLGLEGSFLIPLPRSLYVRGQLSYQRISLETSGGGQITDDEGVTGGTDSLIVGSVNLGIAF